MEKEMLKQIHVQFYPPEWPHGNIKKHWYISGLFIDSTLLLDIWLLNLGKYCLLRSPAEIKYKQIKIWNMLAQAQILPY